MRLSLSLALSQECVVRGVARTTLLRVNFDSPLPISSLAVPDTEVHALRSGLFVCLFHCLTSS